MDYSMKIFLLCFILFRVLGPIRTTIISSPSPYDYTKNCFNNIIKGIFRASRSQNMNKLIDGMINSHRIGSVEGFEWRKVASMATLTNVRIINAYSSHSSNFHVSYEFLSNTIKLYVPELVLHVLGDVLLNAFSHSKTPDDFDSFDSTVRFDGCTISARRQSNISSEWFLDDLKYNGIDIKTAGEILRWEDMDDRYSVFKLFKQLLPPVLRKHMNRNEKFLHALGEIYNNLSIGNILKHHPFPRHQDHHYYLIPNIPVESFNLRNVVVRGFRNIDSLNIYATSGSFNFTLLMKDIRGSMILEDVGTITTSTLELRFFIKSLYMFGNQKLAGINVHAETFSIIETKSNTTLTEVQSTTIMDQIELAIGSSITSSFMKYLRTNRSSTHLSMLERLEMDTILRELSMEKSENSDRTRAHTNTTNISYNYHVSFGDTIINLISGNLKYTERMQCPLPANSNFTYRVNVVLPTRKNSSNNNEANAIDVNFHFNYPSVNPSVITPNNSAGNDSCTFQIQNNQDIEIESLPTTGNRTRSESQLQIKKKIDATLLSMTKDRIVRVVKPIVCLPFDVCSQIAKTVDEFFLGFVDIVLRKCSLRKNETSQT